MTKLAECTPGMLVVNVKLSGSENHKGFVLYDKDLTFVADVSPRDEDGKEGCANAQLYALAWDHALLLAAITPNNKGSTHARFIVELNTGQLEVYIPMLRRSFDVSISPFGTPQLTPELRAALCGVVGIKESKQ